MAPHASIEVMDSTGYTPSVANLHKLHLSCAPSSPNNTDIVLETWKLSSEHLREIKTAVQGFEGLPYYRGTLLAC